MTITSLIENTTTAGLPVEHGLSLYIQKDDGQNILFDMGQGSLFAANAKTMGLSIANVDKAIISHGHYDHGGGLSTFIAENNHAQIYVHPHAFQPHYSLRSTGFHSIGLDSTLQSNPRLVFTPILTRLAPDMLLFSNVMGDICTPTGNRLLFGPTKIQHDKFTHEQHLIIQESDHTTLFAGCAHRGIVNIIRKAERLIGSPLTHVFAGMHLVKSGLDPESENQFIQSLASELMQHTTTRFFTMHCTGEEQYQKLKSIMGNQIEYMSCGDVVSL